MVCTALLGPVDEQNRPFPEEKMPWDTSSEILEDTPPQGFAAKQQSWVKLAEPYRLVHCNTIHIRCSQFNQ